MKQGILAIFLILTMLAGCSPKASITLPFTQESPTASETPVTTPTTPTSTVTLIPSQELPIVTETPKSTPTTQTPLSPSTPPPTPTQTRPLPPLNSFMKGITFGAWKSFDEKRFGLYTPPGADQSLRNLAATGANWISLIVSGGQETIASTTIFRTQPRTATDSELKHMIELAHSLGMRVMLRPGIGLSNDPTHWPGLIGTAFTSEDQWQQWFASYRDFINYYAIFAQEAGADMLCIGWEFGGTTHREADWRRVIQEVREMFKGLITYSSLCFQPSFPHGEDARIVWWDAVDYIGVDVWYSLTNKNDPTVEELKKAWTEKGYVALLESLSSKFNKPIIFTEIGYPSYDGANTLPGALQPVAPVDLQEQADCYQAALEVFWGKPWLGGMFWFQWRAEPGVGGLNDTDFCLNGKPVIEMVKKFYLSQ
jgi:hypothetical protein